MGRNLPFGMFLPFFDHYFSFPSSGKAYLCSQIYINLIKNIIIN